MRIKTIAVCAAQVPFFQGGAEEHVDSLVTELRKRGYEVELIKIPYKWYPKKQLFKSIKAWELLDLTESNGKKIDLVISTKFPSYFIRHPNKVLWLTHQYRQIYDLYNTKISEFNQHNIKDKILRKMLIRADTKALRSYEKRFTISKNTVKRLKKFNQITAQHLYIPPKMSGKYTSSAYGEYILAVGRLDKAKRIDLLINALKYCDKKIKCKIAGKGPDLERLKDLAKQNNVLERVEFLGFVPDKELLDLYANCFCTFFAPFDEDYGYITLESFLSKKPVITAQDSGGPLEFVEHDVSGIIIDPKDEKKTAEQINALFQNKNKCKTMGSKGHEKVKHINWDHVIKKLVGD